MSAVRLGGPAARVEPPLLPDVARPFRPVPQRDGCAAAALPSPLAQVRRATWREGGLRIDRRTIPEETAVALTYNRVTQAVMMATPTDLEDFAVGFSITERIVARPGDIESLEVVAGADGIELRMWICDERNEAFTARRRYMTGPTGCGLCGIESLAQATRPAPVVTGGPRVSPESVCAAIRSLLPAQDLNARTSAMHAAAFWEPGKGLVALREDVGRHNALDKLAGALAAQAVSAGRGIVLLTSRISVELVQKAAAIGAPLLVAVSAPTALAVRTAQDAGITLAAIARHDGFEVFTHPWRIDAFARDRPDASGEPW
ncbi:MAG: formate dehydrogenase accessory sulfurtransferase FdhD [Alphaproteobacteria bacterium]|nr:formate dehydrogenase accessory sulfurtransferase FdhD [Alphaproteobacteria bacterium]